MALDTYETKAPWILFRYLRGDKIAMLLGGKVRMLCIICGCIRIIYFWPWQVMFPNWCARKNPNKMHPARAAFLMEHYHSNKNKTPLRWAIPLANPQGWKEWMVEQGTFVKGGYGLGTT